jgi:serine/threonine-protein kinase HipA
VQDLFDVPRRPDEARASGPAADDLDPDRLRFSLAGVQMKFSVLNEGERITLPSRNQLGQWIVKLDSTRFPHLVENEFATMAWAREAGFEVPDCELFSREALPEALQRRAPEGSQVFAIRRYDRDGARRIHQEDFAQVVGLYPHQKYDQIRYEQLALLARAIEGRDAAYDEVVRRLVLMIATGNYDAHLKNWSLLYPDGIRAQLSPLYDQVAIAAWPGEVERTWALKLAGVKDPFQTDARAFARLAERAGADPEATLRLVRETLERLMAAWPASDAPAVMPTDHVAHLKAYWRRVPLLRACL